LKKIIGISLTLLLSLSMYSSAFAAKSENTLYEANEIKDLNVLFNKAFNGETDFKEDKKQFKTQANLTNENDKTKTKVATYTTTQKLKVVEKNGEKQTDYATTVFAVANVGMSASSSGSSNVYKDTWDNGLGIQAYSTYYYSYTDDGPGAVYKKLTQASGGWVNTLADEYTLGAKTVLLVDSGFVKGGGYLNQESALLAPTSSTFNYATVGWSYIHTENAFAMGVKTHLAFKHRGTPYNLDLDNDESSDF
jgi:hypothetical protein